MDSHQIMSYLDHFLPEEGYHEQLLCSPSELHKIDRNVPISYVILHIPTDISGSTGHFCLLVIDRYETYYGSSLIKYFWFDPIGKSPEFYKLDFLFDCWYDNHSSYMTESSNSSGFHVIHYIECYNKCTSYWDYKTCVRRMTDNKVQEKIKSKMENVIIHPTSQPLLLPMAKKDVINFFYDGREE